MEYYIHINSQKTADSIPINTVGTIVIKLYNHNSNNNDNWKNNNDNSNQMPSSAQIGEGLSSS